MRKAIVAVVGALGIVVVFVAVLTLSIRLRRDVGQWAVAVVACSFLAAWVGHTPESLKLLRHFVRGLREFESDKEAAYEVGVSPSLVAMWKSGQQIPPLWKIAKWGRRFWVTFCVSYLEEDGEYLPIKRTHVEEVRVRVLHEREVA